MSPRRLKVSGGAGLPNFLLVVPLFQFTSLPCGFPLCPFVYCKLLCNVKFWRAPIIRNRSRDAIVALLSGRLSVHSTCFWVIFTQGDRFPRKFDVQTSYKPSNYVLGLIFVVNISSSNLSRDSAFDRRTLLFKYYTISRIFFTLSPVEKYKF